MAEEEKIEQLLTALEGVAQGIRRLEEDALQALHEQKDQETYKQKMREKSLVLESLPLTLEPVLEDLPAGFQQAVEERVDRFAQSAAMALSLESAFFMSALLYPENYQDGEPNDLERFIFELKQQAGMDKG